MPKEQPPESAAEPLTSYILDFKGFTIYKIVAGHAEGFMDEKGKLYVNLPREYMIQIEDVLHEAQGKLIAIAKSEAGMV